jgi:hypothetical protein
MDITRGLRFRCCRAGIFELSLRRLAKYRT